MMLGRVVNKEDYRYALLLATLFHIVLFLALFLTLRHSTKLLFLAPPPLQVIHATAISMDSLPKKITKEPEKMQPVPSLTQAMSKPILLEKSPVALPIKEKKIYSMARDKTTPVKAPLKGASFVKKVLTPPPAKTTKSPKKIEKKTNDHALKPSKAALKLVEKNIQQLLDQEMKSVTKQHINAARNAATTDKYRHLILQAIAQQWIIPPKISKDLETKLTVHLAPGGMVLEVIIVKSSGNPVLDRSAQTAVYKASPLPVPKKGLFQTFRQINLTVRPEGVITQ
jgi:colicin import membrane protein